jgi:hypothetical protein
MTAVAAAVPRAVTRTRVTAFLLLATFFSVTFEKIHWNISGSLELADVLTILFLLAFALTSRGVMPRTTALMWVGTIALIGFWPAFGLCLALRRFSGFRIAAFLSLIAHEGSVPILIFKEFMSERSSYVGRAWSAVPLWVLVFLGVYLVGQVWFWVLALSPVRAKFADKTEQQLPVGGQV